MRRRRVGLNAAMAALLTLACCAGAVGSSRAETVTLEAGRDATLIEDPDGAQANGSGPVFFAGRTSQDQNGVRRALVWFDVAAALPADAVVEDARLLLTMISGNEAAAVMRLQRVLADWGEGASSATGGVGDDAEPGDATWLHTFYDDDYWPVSGGQFVGHESASLTVAGAGVYTFGGTRALVRDVGRWLAAPHRNFGWILLGDETTRTSAKRFASRDNPDPTLRPVLEITYSRRPGAAGSRSPRR